MAGYINRQLDVCGMLEDLYEMSMATWRNWGVLNSTNEAWAVADYKTIGVMAGRQCGLTRGAFKWALKRPGECVMITKDATLCKAIRNNYQELEGGNPDDVVWLSPLVKGSLEHWTKEIGTDRLGQIRYVIVDDSAYTLNAGYVGRSNFNKWVAETFHPDTFVILIK